MAGDVATSGRQLHVIPLLRKAGVFRTEYTGRTLREHYGIPRPENVFTVAGPEARADVA
jgi:hypothetical protein